MADAEKYFLKAIELQPNTADFHFNLATVYRRQQKTQEAIGAYQKAIQLDSRLAPAHYDLGVLYAQLKRNDEAIDQWNMYLDLKAQQDPKEADIVRKHIKELGGKPH
jgi:tetratricopeptide (TPR) repeat protein